MLSRMLRTKESKIILALLALILLITGIIIFSNYASKKKYEEQAVMAKEFLEAGNYDQAIDAYIKAMSMKNSNKELLSIGLAEAYVGVNNYNKALEVLRKAYKDTSGTAIKEKIEEVTTMKTDYEFLKMIETADTYYANKEYEKAITEYEKAKLIKSKEAISYKRIAESYIAMENYELAREEVLEGLELTQSEELNKVLLNVDAYLLKKKYEEIIREASEYIYQENYEEAMKKYNEAKKLMPNEEAAYEGLAEIYIATGDYESAVELLKKILNQINSKQLEDILTRANGLLDEANKRKRILKELYTAVNDTDTDNIIKLMSSKFFLDKIAVNTPIYYSTSGEGNISSGRGMIIIDAQNIYSGGLQDTMKKGYGIHIMLTEKKGKDWYYYKGEWSNDLPNGKGETKEKKTEHKKDGAAVSTEVVTQGNFINGIEYGAMQKIFYRESKEIGNIQYSAKNGIPVPILDQDGNQIQVGDKDQYAIGEIYRKKEPTGQYYGAETNAVWGVRSYIKDKSKNKN